MHACGTCWCWSLGSCRAGRDRVLPGALCLDTALGCEKCDVATGRALSWRLQEGPRTRSWGSPIEPPNGQAWMARRGGMGPHWPDAHREAPGWLPRPGAGERDVTACVDQALNQPRVPQLGQIKHYGNSRPPLFALLLWPQGPWMPRTAWLAACTPLPLHSGAPWLPSPPFPAGPSCLGRSVAPPQTFPETGSWEDLARPGVSRAQVPLAVGP
ncbi:hypothetical protein VULLAG_LOCUS10933 [Vulpes lagopus]